MSDIRLDDIEYFNISLDNYDRAFGGDQQWYPTIWQQRAGCGPTTASNMFYYLALTNPDICAEFYPYETIGSKKEFVRLMEDVWEYVTPTKMGVNKTEIFVEGAYKYAKSKGLDLNCISLDVPNLCMRKNLDTETFLEFIRDGLAHGCPVAFLNLSNGKVSNLHRWHWITLMSLYQGGDGDYYCTVSDEGTKKEINLKLWFETSALGGGLVYFTI